MKRFLQPLFLQPFFLVLCMFLLGGAVLFTADSGISISSTIVANNTNPITIKATGGIVYQVDAYANGTSLAYVKLYDATATTCGTGTPKARYLIPFGASSAGGGFVTPNINGDGYAFGIQMCVTGAISDADTSAPAATTFIVNVHYK